MAIYHCSVQVIGRSTGRSVVAASAYRSGTKMTSMYDGITSDYTGKRWIEHTEVLLPIHAPTEYYSRNQLWNAVEMSEKSRDSQLAREVELALPIELNMEQNISLVRNYVKENFVNQGMCADIAIHNPPVTNDRHQPINEQGLPTRNINEMIFNNPHAHILLTMRPIDANGKWEAKSQKEYICIRNNEEKGFTAGEYKQAKQDGWEKQYKYFEKSDFKNTIWLSASEGEESGLTRVDRNPKCSPYGRKNPTVEHWNDKQRIEEWRKSWEISVNNKLCEIGREDIRVDSRSYKAQGIDKVATIHMGPNAANMEKRAMRQIAEGVPDNQIIHSDIAEINNSAKEYNKISDKLFAIKNRLREIKESLVETAHKIRDKIAELIKHDSVKKTARQEQISMENRIQAVNLERTRIDEANRLSYDRLNELAILKSSSTFGTHKIDKQIHEEHSVISKRNEYLNGVLAKYGFSEWQDYYNAVMNYDKGTPDDNNVSDIIRNLRKNYSEIISVISEKTNENVQEETKDISERDNSLFR